MHGKTKDINIKGKIKKSGDTIHLTSDFSVNVDDFDIEIPSVVSKKLSKQVNISIDFELK